MIRTNLATRPFYNERAVQFALLALAAITIAATFFNGTRIVQLSRRDTSLMTQAQTDESVAAAMRAQSARLRASVDTRALETASADARLANDLIGRRTFSWTELFNRLETTVPDDVRFTSVRPKLDAKRGIVLTLVVVAKTVDDVNTFIDRLEETGAFSQLQKLDERLDDENQWLATLESVYSPGTAKPATEAPER